MGTASVFSRIRQNRRLGVAFVPLRPALHKGSVLAASAYVSSPPIYCGLEEFAGLTGLPTTEVERLLDLGALPHLVQPAGVLLINYRKSLGVLENLERGGDEQRTV